MNIKDYTYVYTEEKTPHDVYDAKLLKNLNLPQNFQIIDFRPPVANEWFLADHGAPMRCLDVTYAKYSPRFILKKLHEIVRGCEETSISVKEVYGGDVKIPEGWKFERFGIPKQNDFTLVRGTMMVSSLPWGCNSVPADYLPRIILKKVS